MGYIRSRLSRSIGPAQTAGVKPSPARLTAARNLRRTRAENAQEVAQDYVELIGELITTRGEARVTDLARRLGVTHVTVNRAIQRLRRAGLANSIPYRAVYLTKSGERLAQQSRRRHELVSEFLKSLGVPEGTAHADAEGMEHHVSRATLNAFKAHLGRRGRKL